MLNTLKTIGFWAGEILGAISIFAVPYLIMMIAYGFGLE